MKLTLTKGTMNISIAISLLLITSLVTTSSIDLIQPTQKDREPQQKHKKEVINQCSKNSTAFQNQWHNTDKNSCGLEVHCLPWAMCNDSKCVCKKGLKMNNVIVCDEATLQLSVLTCHCVTFDNKTKQLIEGHCLENCYSHHDIRDYLPLPLDVSSLNRFMCEDRWNRTGRLCGKCLPGHSPLVYSYDMRCVKCPEGNENVWKYILAAFGPLTIFYFIVLFFKINATSSHLHGYIIFSQIIATPAFARTLVAYNTYHPNTRILVTIGTVLYGIWNLDFFKDLYPDICLDVSPLTALALDYTVAIYPLLLTVVSCVLIELHARNVRLVVFLWKPFRFLLTLFRKNWNSRTTVIDAYASFFLLSFVKILCVSADLLIPTRARDLNTNNTMWVLYYDATVEYFGQDHLPYAILALVFCSMLAIIPTMLLLLYPFKWFQKMLNCLHINYRTLQVVMESFHGRYKNGTELGTKDCRWFAAVPLIGRFILVLIYALTLDSSFLPLATATIICIMSATVMVQPYKILFAKYTNTDTIFWGFLAIFYSIYQSGIHGFTESETLLAVAKVLRIIMGIVPLVYMFCISAYWILSRMRKVKILIDRVKAWRRGYADLEEGFEASLPDRLVNPEQYQEVNLQEPIICDDNSAENTTDNDTY